MKDKEKQIEQMAQVIRPILKNRVDIGFIPDLDKPIAEELIKQGYSKPPEDSVVLLRERYIQANKVYSDTTLKSWKKEELIEHIRILEHNWASAENQIDNQVKNFEKLLKQARNETAKEIYDYLQQTGVIKVAPDTIRMYFKEEFGVEIKE